MTKKKPEKSANDMTDDELIKSVFPARVVEQIRREHHLDDPDERKELGNDESIRRD